MNCFDSHRARFFFFNRSRFRGMCSAQGDSESPSPRRRPEKEDAVSCSSQHSVHMVYVSNIGSVHSLGRSSAALTRNSSLDTGCIREYSLGGRRKFLPKVSEVLEYSSPAVSSVFRVEWGQSTAVMVWTRLGLLYIAMRREARSPTTCNGIVCTRGVHLGGY